MAAPEPLVFRGGHLERERKWRVQTRPRWDCQCRLRNGRGWGDDRHGELGAGRERKPALHSEQQSRNRLRPFSLPRAEKRRPQLSHCAQPLSTWGSPLHHVIFSPALSPETSQVKSQVSSVSPSPTCVLGMHLPQSFNSIRDIPSLILNSFSWFPEPWQSCLLSSPS